jgi:hypothetical protein
LQYKEDGNHAPYIGLAEKVNLLVRRAGGAGEAGEQGEKDFI